MKLLIFGLTLLLNATAFAHEGHSDMPSELAKFGGSLENVVDYTKMQAKEKNNLPLMKAEFVRSEDGTVRLYLFDLKMKQLQVDSLSKEAEVTVENPKEKTHAKFTMKPQGDHFIGKIPTQKKKPFNIYIYFIKDAKKFFVAFDNLD